MFWMEKTTQIWINQIDPGRDTFGLFETTKSNGIFYSPTLTRIKLTFGTNPLDPKISGAEQTQNLTSDN